MGEGVWQCCVGTHTGQLKMLLQIERTVQGEEQLTNVYKWHDFRIKHHRFFLPLGKGGSVFLQQELWIFCPGHLQSEGIGNVMLNCWRMHMSMIMIMMVVMTLNLNLNLSNYTIILFVL